MRLHPALSQNTSNKGALLTRKEAMAADEFSAIGGGIPDPIQNLNTTFTMRAAVSA